MDGVEMLTKLKSDPALKSIPVIMLTAEGGRDNVLKIAKIGVRDYIVKPFKEDLLIEKVGRIIDLKPISEGSLTKARSIFDPASILVIDDKPAIVLQIQEGIKHTPWKITGVNTAGEAIDHCSKTPPDLVIISLSLPDESAFTLFRLLRTNIKTKYTPIFGLVVKTDITVIQQAQQVGFSSIVTKPIEVNDLESKIAKAMNLDTSERYFKIDDNILVMRLPENTTPAVLVEINNYLKPKTAEAVDSGIFRAVVDLHELKRFDMTIIKLLFSTMQTFRELALQYVLVGNPQIVTECKGFEDTKGWQFVDSLAGAKSHLCKQATNPAMETTG